MNIETLILYVGATTGFIAFVLQVHQRRMNRPSFAFTFEGSHGDIKSENGAEVCYLHKSGLIRNSSLDPNTIARIHLVVWKDDTFTRVLRHGHGIHEIRNLATDELLKLPLRMESRSAIRAECIFRIRLSGTSDGDLMREYVPIPSSIPNLAAPKHEYEMIFEDAAGNYFHRSGKLLSRTLIDLNLALQNYKGWDRVRHYFKIAKWWLRWKRDVALSWLGFYK